MVRTENQVNVLVFKRFTMNTDNLIVINLAAILIGSTFNADQKVIKWGGLIVAVASVATAIVGG